MAAIKHGSPETLRSTFPSTSVTAWTSAVMGAEPAEHGLLGNVFRLPGTSRVVDVLSGRAYSWTDAADWDDHPIRLSTLFERAADAGARPIVVGREFDGLRGPWPVELFRGAERVTEAAPGDLPVAAPAVARSVIAQVNEVLAAPQTAQSNRPLLLWAYVNLDVHIHLHGNDDALLEAVRLLDEAAAGWADAGWDVVSHADHGHTEVVRAPELERALAAADTPDHCRLPGGGAGRVRWLYPRPDQAERVAATLREELADCALVTTPAELAGRGLLSAAAASSRRLGEIVLVATAATFPIPSADYRYDHGALTDEELFIPFISWRR